MSFFRRYRPAAVTALVVGLVLLAGGGLLQAQTSSASVSGVVKDPQGAVVVNATVTLTSKTQGSTITTTTNAQGGFAFPIVRPDTYVLKVAAAENFKTLEQTNVVVNANDKLSVGTLTLELGQLTEAITVSSRVSELQAESGERSYALESEAIRSIASNSRQLFNYALLVPGIVSTDTNAGTERNQVSSIVVNGMRETSNNVTVDGVANIDTGDNGGNMAVTNTEAIAEFKVLTSSYQAEYGRAVGGQVQMVTKSGSQSFHGSGYWFGRRADWNANSWTNKRAAMPKPVGNGAITERPVGKRDDFGWTIGGPIYIPGVFNTDKKKLFFFWSEEFQKRQNPPAGQRTARVPTALERAGDFSQSVDNSGNPYPYIRDYTKNAPCNATNQAGCFADGGVLGKIPADRLYPLGLAALNIFPQPNFTGGGGTNYMSQDSDSGSPRSDLIRLDFQPSDKWRITGRYMQTKNDTTQAYGTPWAGNGSYQVPLPTLFKNPGYNFMISTSGIINNTTSIELSFGRAHNSLDYEMQRSELFRANSGLSGFPYLYPDAVQADYVPMFQFGGTNMSGAEYQTDRGPFTNYNTTTDVVANLTKIFGAHNTKFGVYYQHSAKPQSIFYSFNAQVDFAGEPNNPFDTSFAYANAATGVFNRYTQANRYAQPMWEYKNVEFFLQDNWKASSRLTIDAGVRFYYMTPQWDTNKAVSNFLPDKFDFANAAQLYRPAIVGGQKVGLDPTTGETVDQRFIGRLTPSSNRFNGAYTAGNGISDTVQSGSVFKVSPRLGFVFDVTGQGSTIVRGAGGIFYDRPMGNIVFDMGGNAPATLNSDVRWGMLQTLGSGGQSDPYPTLSLSPTEYEFNPPRVIAWNVGLQQKLPGKLIFDISYVGNKADNLVRRTNVNAPALGATFDPANQDPTKTPSSNGSGALATDFLRPYQGYGDLNMYRYNGFSTYNSLQTSLQRRFDNGLMFALFYVWSKNLTTNFQDYSIGGAEGGINADHDTIRRYDYSYSNWDRPHNIVLNFVYQTPKVTDNLALGLIANGWQLSGVWRMTSGQAYAINYSIPNATNDNLTGTSIPSARIALTCDPGSGTSSDPYKQFDTSCFAPPQQGSNGLESARRFMHGPWTNNLDLSISKSFTFYKDIKFEVRLDAFNALNHTQFTGVNNTANFKSVSDPTITNLPYNASGELVNLGGFGTVNGAANPRTLQLVTRLTF